MHPLPGEQRLPGLHAHVCALHIPCRGAGLVLQACCLHCVHPLPGEQAAASRPQLKQTRPFGEQQGLKTGGSSTSRKDHFRLQLKLQ